VNVIIVEGRDISKRIALEELGMFKEKGSKHRVRNSQSLWIGPPGQHYQGLVVTRNDLKHTRIGHGRVFHMIKKDVRVASNIMEGMLWLNFMFVYALIDSGATHSFA
jgi:hypothetical protein